MPERFVSSYDLMNDSYSAQRTFRNSDRVQWIDPRKVYKLYKTQPTSCVLNESAYSISRANGSQELKATISAGFLRADLKFLDNRLWIVAGARYERTDDKGAGAANDIRATYQQDAPSNVLRNAAGQLIRVSSDALTTAKLQSKERGALDKKHYGDLYPSVNASYSFSENFVARAAYAQTIGRPDISSIIPSRVVFKLVAGNRIARCPDISSIIPSRVVTDPSLAEAARTLTTNNAALKPWTADTYNFSVETYSVKGATFSASLLRKNVTGFFVSTRTDAALALLNEMGLSDDYLDDAVITTTNSKDSVKVDGLEWSWRQSLKPLTGLPKWSRGVQLWVNATHLRIGGAGADEFSGYSPRMINWAASYAGAKVLVRYNVSRIARPARIAQRRQRDHARRHLQRAGHPHGPGREYRVSASPAVLPRRLGAQPRQRTAPAHDLLNQRPRLHPSERLHLFRSVVDDGG